MKRARGPACAILVALALVRCGSEDRAPASPVPTLDASAVIEPAADAPDTSDPRCQARPVLLTTHPHASLQATDIGKDLVDTRGWNGRLYFAYGDLSANTGPIVVSSLEPATTTWTDHLTFDTERIQRFRPIGNALWAPAADPRGDADPSYALGTAEHAWEQRRIGRAYHVVDVAERAPNDVYLVGSDSYDSDAGTYNGLYGGAVWRSQDGGPFERIFPIINPPNEVQYVDVSGWLFSNTAAIGGKLYVVGVLPAWVFDGTTWAYGPDMGSFVRPTNFANQLVFATLGELWAFDGTATRSLRFTLFNPHADYQVLFDSLAVFEETEGRLLAVDATGAVQVTTDLVEWKCIGRAPADVRSIGSLEGTVYFGGAQGRVYRLPAPSW
jgi:hypothetical protein